MVILLSIISNFVLIAKNSSICEENKLSQVTLYYQFLQPNAAITSSDVMVTSQPWPQESLLITARKRNLGQGNIFRPVSVCPRGEWVGLRLCLGGGGLCSGGSVSRGWSLSRGSLSRGSLSRGSVSRGLVSVQGGLCPGYLCPVFRVGTLVYQILDQPMIGPLCIAD